MIGKITAALMVSAYALMPNSANAAKFESATGLGCLDVYQAEKKGTNGNGYNVIVWQHCTAAANQNWQIEGQSLSVQLNGKKYYLDVHLAEKVQAGANAGFNVIAWPTNHRTPNQQWTRTGDVFSVTIDGKKYCLDVDQRKVHAQNASGKSYNVIAWPLCHGNINQKWSEKG